VGGLLVLRVMTAGEYRASPYAGLEAWSLTSRAQARTCRHESKEPTREENSADQCCVSAVS
jgi:hypothetical protein